MSRVRLYISTVAHLKARQVAYRVWRRLGGKTPLRSGYIPKPNSECPSIVAIPVLSELDFDPVFLARFDVDAILEDRLEILYHKERVDWGASWHAELSSPLWRFNLHYHEYLLPLAKAFIDSGDEHYLDKAKSIVSGWISACPRSRGGVAWDPYVISMRAVNWLAFFGEVSDALAEDAAFVTRANESLAEQYVHLSQHLEKDLLANHYLENLKALVILACHFRDDGTLAIALPLLQGQIDEQILPDGMHFELSPMYHKVVLEDLLRTAAFLEAYGHRACDFAVRFRLQDMCDVLWSLERNVNRTPLFNDSGDNVAKSRDALLACACNHFGIVPIYKNKLPDAGYAILERETAVGIVKVILDAGKPGPRYAMGHAHCDALSIEVFVGGKPWIVNGGTYTYQGESRLAYKRTLSHSAVRVDGEEQHECWAPFRIASYSEAHLLACDGCSAGGVLTQRGTGVMVRRTVSLRDDYIVVRDEAIPACRLEVAFIFAHDMPSIEGAEEQAIYSSDFGFTSPARRIVKKASDRSLETKLPYPSPFEGDD